MKKLQLLFLMLLSGISTFAQTFPILGTVPSGQIINVFTNTSLTDNTNLTLSNTGAASLKFYMASSPSASASVSGVIVPPNSIVSVPISQLGGIGAGRDLNAFNFDVNASTVPTTFEINCSGCPPVKITPNYDCSSTLPPTATWINDSKNNNVFLCPSGSKVGIGTLTPGYTLEVIGSGRFSAGVRIDKRLSCYDGVLIQGNSTIGALDVESLGSNMASFYYNGDQHNFPHLDLTGSINNVGLRAGSNASNATFSIGTYNAPKTILIQPNGNVGISANVGIGTTPDATHALAVNGSLLAKSIDVRTNWSDFVFEKDYALMSLADLEDYIHQNRHLPEIPAAKEVEDNGANVGDMLKLQMQKIEELTLYVIEQNKKLTAQQKEIDALKKRRK